MQSTVGVVRLTVLLRAPACRAATIAEALRVLVRPTRVESGCLGCRVWTGVDAGETAKDEMLVHYQERWSSEAAVERRVASDAFTKVLEVLEAGAGPPEVEFDFVTRQAGLEYVEEVRRGHH